MELYIWVVSGNNIAFRKAKYDDGLISKLEAAANNRELLSASIRNAGSLLGNTLRFALPVDSDQSTTHAYDEDSLCHQLYDMLITPIEDLLPLESANATIYVVPHEALFMVSFSSLRKSELESYFIERYCITTCPSVSWLATNASKGTFSINQASL